LNIAESLKITFRWLKKIFILNLFFLLVMTLFRLSALIVYGQINQWNLDAARAFTLGIRFDAVVLGYLMAIPCVYLVIALHLKKESWFDVFAKWIQVYYFIFFLLVACILAVDIGYYSYFQDHLNILVFGFIDDDTWALMRTFWKNYPVIWYLLAVILCAICLRALINLILRPFRHKQTFEKIHPSVPSVVSLALFAIVFMLGRGSFGLFPLGPADTVISSDPFMNYLTTNGIHTLHRAIKLRRTQGTSWNMNMTAYGYNEAHQAFADFYQIPLAQVPPDPLSLLSHQTPRNEWALKTKPHVILLMMESFGSHWLSFQSPQFNLMGEFEKHSQSDFLLKNFMPSANSTTGSLSSMMISAPKRPLGNFLTESEYLQVSFRSSPAKIYGSAGYKTHFIYGGNPGWRDMNKFARFQGFNKVEGDVDIEKSLGPLAEKHDWGIYDEDVFRYVEKILHEATEPQFILVMTTTNHPPYQIPRSYEKLPLTMPPEIVQKLTIDKDLALSRFQTYQYSLQKLGQFLTSIKSSDLATKTIIAATGDHSFLPISFSEEEVMKKWSVPFYLYTPAAIKKNWDHQIFGSHMDIFPTLYHLSLSETKYDALGVNLLDPQQTHWSYHDTAMVTGPEGGVLVFGKDNQAYLDWRPSEKTPYDRLIGGTETETKKLMAQKFRSMMAVLDYYLWAERKAKQ
jgi:phosphoglycerol transferase MdoB-like AlkP superfamily enzyme